MKLLTASSLVLIGISLILLFQRKTQEGPYTSKNPEVSAESRTITVPITFEAKTESSQQNQSIDQLAVAISNLAPDDHDGLVHLESKIDTFIRSDSQAFTDTYLENYLPYIPLHDLRVSFFFIQAIFRSAPNPFIISEKILELTLPEDLKTEGHSHSSIDPAQKLDIVKTFTIDQMTHAVGKFKTEKEKQEMRNLVRKISEEHPNLALARSAAKLSMHLSERGVDELEEIIASRSNEEAFAFEDLRHGHH